MRLIRIAIFALSLAPLLSGLGDNALAQDRWEKRNADREKSSVSEKLKKKAKTARKAWLGVEVATVDREFSREHDLSVTRGVYIEDVVDDSPAEDAGLRRGDVIIEYNGNTLRAADELIDLVADGSRDDEVTLLIDRDGREIKEIVELGEWRDYRERSFNTFRFGDNDMMFGWKERYSNSYIGVSLENISGQLAEYFGVDEDGAALVTEVGEDTPAETAGLRAGDVIVEVAGEEIESLSDVQEVVRETDPGESIAVTVVRNKARKTIDVTVDERENSFSLRDNQFFDLDDIDMFRHNRPHVRGFRHGHMDPDVRVFEFEGRDDAMRELERKLKRLERQLEEMQRQLDKR